MTYYNDTKNASNMLDVTAYSTGNVGFDTLRFKNANIAKANGFDVLKAVTETVQHPTIQHFIAKKWARVEVIGCNLYVFTNDDEYVKNRVNSIMHSIWAVHTPTFFQCLTTRAYDVNEVIRTRMQYLPTQAKNLIKYQAKKFTWGFVAGLDVIPEDVMNRCSNNSYQKTLTNREKRFRYN